MAKTAPKILTAAAVEKYKPTGKRRFIKDAGCRALYLCIQPSGRKSFLVRFRMPSGVAKIVLGPLHVGDEPPGDPTISAPLTLAGARLVAAQVLRERAMGGDPVADHRAEKRRRRADAAERRDNTFGSAVRDYVEEHARRKNRNWRDAAYLLGFLYPKDGGKPEEIKDGLAQRWSNKTVREIDGHLIFGVVDEARRIGSPGIKAHNRGISDARGRLLYVVLSSMFSWLQRERRVEVNPCKSVARPQPSPARDRVLTDDEIKIFWKACGSVGQPFEAIFKTLLLTGARLNEVGRMTAAELRDDGATWHLDGSRTKNKKPHVVPLPKLAQGIIRATPRIESPSGFLFTTNGRSPPSGWSRAKARLDAAMLKIIKEGAALTPRSCRFGCTTCEDQRSPAWSRSASRRTSWRRLSTTSQERRPASQASTTGRSYCPSARWR
jgi:integrase